MLATLGLFVFETSSVAFDELERRTDWRHAQTSRFRARPSSQFAGPGDDVLTLTGSVPIEIGDVDALEMLRDMGDAGDSYPLIDGRGKVHGQHVILDLNIREQEHLADGTPRITDFSITLRRVDDDQAQAGKLPASTAVLDYEVEVPEPEEVAVPDPEEGL